MSQPSQTKHFFLLRGLAREARHWGGFIDELAQSNEDCAVTSLEIPGCGKLHTSPSPLHLDDYVEIIRKQFISQHDPTIRNVIIGFSLGGMIASRWICKYPQDFHALVLINSSSSLSPFYKRMTFSGALHLLSTLFFSSSYTKEKILAGLLCNLADTKQIAEQWTAIRDDAPVSSVNAFRQLMAASTFKLDTNISIPPLILCSKKDRLVSWHCSAAIAQAWGIGPHYHPLAGHDLTTDDPSWCSRQIHLWLDKDDCDN